MSEFRQARPVYLPLPDTTQPVAKWQRWSERIATGIACLVIGFALMVAVIR